MVVEVEHERLGRVPTLGTPIKVDGSRASRGAAAAARPAHRRGAGDAAQISSARVEALRREGVIA